ncbi:hypothetical protein BDA99DRAFT_540191, partial [Phascolomyces articulosus]
TIKLVYYDIKNLCELLFNYKEFWDNTILLPKTWERNGKQVKIPVGIIVLALMLSSDETVVTGNSRSFAYPLYIKLGNTLKDIQNKGMNRASHVLAYFLIPPLPK